MPYFPGKRYVDWDLPDPRGAEIDDVRAVRDDVGDGVNQLLAQLG
jgi:protein-tyrosine-phosphatase